MLLQQLLNHLEVWVGHLMVLLEELVSFSKVFPSSDSEKEAEVGKDKCW